jgi:glycosyltransferase involved in cell wall biosynthesis
MLIPSLTLIIPVYNRALVIGEMLDSILSQTSDDWECIIIDDGSTDNIDAVIKSYSDSDKRFCYYRRPDFYKSGGNGARNYGFSISNGDFVNFIDSDDILHQDFVKEKLNAIKSSEADVVISKSILTTMDINEVIRFEDRTILSFNLLEDFIDLKISWYIVDPVWRKSFLKGKEIFDENLLKGQDRDFHIRMLMESPKIEILHKHLYYYRNNPNSISTNVSENVGLSMLKIGLKRNRTVIKFGVSNETKFFLFKQLIKIYPSVFKSEGILNLYAEVCKVHFVLNLKNLNYFLKFILAVLSFNVFGKGEKFLR